MGENAMDASDSSFNSNGMNNSAAPIQEVAGPAPPVVPVAMPFLQQSGEVFVGPGARKEAELLGLGLTKLSSRRKDDLQAAKRYAMDISIKQIMMRQQKTHQENQQKQAMYAQALSLMARVYIGSISFEVREENIKKSFEVYGPIKTINMSFDPSTGHHKGFAFLEYEVPEAALLAQESMNSHLMGGRNLKVGRPSNMPQAQPIIEMVQQDAKKYHRVYVSSVHPDLSETDLKSVFEAFGDVIKCQLARQNGSGKGTHRGFGYIEFNNPAAMTEAIAGMNMFDLGGQYLRVGRCITPPEALQYLTPSTPLAIPAAAAVAAAAVTARVMAAEATGSSKGSASASPAQCSSPRPQSPRVGYESPMKASPPRSPSLSQLSLEASRPPAVKTELPEVRPPPVVKTELAEVRPPARAAIATPPHPQFTEHVQVKEEPTYPSPSVSYVEAPAAPPPPPSRRSGFGGFAGDIPPPSNVAVGSPAMANIPPPGVANIPAPGVASIPPPGTYIPPAMVTAALPPPPPPQEKPEKKHHKKKGGVRSFDDKLNTLLDKTRSKQEAKNAGPLKFGPQDPWIAPKDPLAPDEQNVETQLAITGDVQSMALAIIGDGSVVAAGKIKHHDGAEPETKKKKQYGQQRAFEPKKIQPKLNSKEALEAVAKAGALVDAVMANEISSEDLTLARQEGMLNIRGNDARHLLMAKLMRTNRSCIIVLRNMVGPEDIDEYLEGEIKEECSKFGKVQEVVIANDEGAGIVKIFVRFMDPKEVDAAKEALNGRFFAGRTIGAEVYDQALFDHNDLSG